MRIGRLLIGLALIVILGLVAFYAVTTLGGQATDGPTETTDIVIAVQTVPRGGVISPEALGYLAFPTEDTIANMFTSIDAVAGMRAKYDLEPGVPITNNMIAGAGTDFSESGSDSALLIPEGMVAFPISIDRFSSVAYGLRAGDHVNVISTLLLVDLEQEFQTVLPNDTGAVIAPGNSVLLSVESEDGGISSSIITDPALSNLTAQIASGGSTAAQGQAELDPVLNQPFYLIPSEAQRPRIVSQTLLQDVVVLHVGNFLYTDETGAEVTDAYQPRSTGVDSTGQPISAGPKAPPDIITLIVSPQDAVTLNYMLYAGAKLNLAMRSSGDASVTTTEAVTLDYLLNTYNIPVPGKLPYGLEPRVDILQSPPLQLNLPNQAPE